MIGEKPYRTGRKEVYLTSREMEILGKYKESDFSLKKCADELKLSSSTVSLTLSRIRRKARKCLDTVKLALEEGIISEGEVLQVLLPPNLHKALTEEMKREKKTLKELIEDLRRGV